ncbi:hypothetical protein FUAX_26700 [Fulvitalea axinellae]|uniref:Lipoprotein n=1 Tax=Fulvitalea axinellae TaxID=1182444 RepID=A0AAU9D2Q8_9BACT|nr:hypothetical protein FUAX_26700 [Fulvitalea axinellae]
MYRFTVLIILALALSSCAAKRYRKLASQFEKAGLVDDAADYYYRSLVANQDNVEAKLGLRKNGQIVLDKKFGTFRQSYENGSTKSAVYQYKEATEYAEKVKRVGVQLFIAPEQKSYYEEALTEFLDQRYTEGMKALNAEEFQKARKTLEEIARFKSGFRDVDAKLIIARYEPVYRQGIDELERGLPRSAYYRFSKVLSGSKTYKDAEALKKEALDKATINVVVIPFTTSRIVDHNVHPKFMSSVNSGLHKMRSPFYRMIDGQGISPKMSLDEQLKIAKERGGHAILVGHISEAQLYEGRLQAERQKCYLKETKEYKDENGEKKTKVIYHKTWFTEYNKKHNANLSLDYKLVSTASGEIWSAGNYNNDRSANLHYAKYDGNYKRLVPGYWKYKSSNSDKDEVKDSSYSVNSLRRLFQGRQSIPSATALANELVADASRRLVKSVEKFNPEKK